MGVLRRRRQRGARLRRLGLSLGVPRRRQEPREALRQHLEIGRSAEIRREADRRRPEAAHGRHRRLSDRHRRRRPHGPVRPARRPEPDAEGRPGLHVHARQQGMEFRRRSGLDHVVRRRVGAGPEVPDPRRRPLCRPRRARLALGNLPGQFAVPAAARRQARLFGPHAARAGFLRALDAVHRLEQVRRPVAQDLQRPAILPRRRGAALAGRAGQGAASLHARRRLAACLDLRHGDRGSRPRRLGLPAIFPDLDGRREAAEARSRTRRGAASCRSTATRPANSASPRTSPMPAATSGPRRRGTPNSPTSPTWACSTSSSPRATCRRCPTSPPTTRATCSSASGAASSRKPATSPAFQAIAPGAAR